MIFVTGSGGFLATYFRKFTKINQKNLLFGSTKKMDLINSILFENQYEDIEEKLENYTISTIIHFASVIPDNFGDADIENILMPNINMLNNIYKFISKKKVKKFIYLSSFGGGGRPQNPVVKDFYTLSKIAGDHYCTILEDRGVSAVSLKVPSPYGEFSNRNNVLNIFIDRALKNEELSVIGSTREQNFIYSGDILRAIELALENEISGQFNIVSEKNTNMKELAEIICKICESKSKITINDENFVPFKPQYVYEVNNRLGYKQKYILKDGLKRYINWKKQQCK